MDYISKIKIQGTTYYFRDKDTVYDDTELRNRLRALENKEDKDTVYDDTNISDRVNKLENLKDTDAWGDYNE